MLINNILVLTVLMSFGFYDVIRGEIIYGEDIPRLNVSEITGKWFMVATTMRAGINESVCCTNEMKQQSADNFTMHIATETKVTERSQTVTRKYLDIDLEATMNNDSNIIFTTSHGQPGPSMVFFDVVSDSYAAIYSLAVGDTIPSDAHGPIVVFSREKILSDEILTKIKESNFYRNAPKIETEIYDIDFTTCD